MMQICVGRWDLLPKDWDENSFSDKSDEEIVAECNRQFYSDEVFEMRDHRVGLYEPRDFVDEWNNDLGSLTTTTYWIWFVCD